MLTLQVSAILCIYTGKYLFKRIKNKMTYFLSKWDGIIWLLICFQSLNYLALYSIMLCTHTKISKREEWKRVQFNIFCFSPTDCGHETQSRVVAVSARALNLSKFWVLQWLILILFLYFTQFMSILLILCTPQYLLRSSHPDFCCGIVYSSGIKKLNITT